MPQKPFTDQIGKGIGSLGAFVSREVARKNSNDEKTETIPAGRGSHKKPATRKSARAGSRGGGR